jgi:hypothetical protein
MLHWLQKTIFIGLLPLDALGGLFESAATEAAAHIIYVVQPGDIRQHRTALRSHRRSGHNGLINPQLIFGQKLTFRCAG